MRFPKLAFNRRRRPTATGSAQASAQPSTPVEPASRSTFYAIKSTSTVSFAASRAKLGNEHSSEGSSSVDKTAGDGFIRKLARRIASKQELWSTRRPPLAQLSFDDSDDDDAGFEDDRARRSRPYAFGQRVLPSPPPPVDVELLSSMSPFCTDEEERMRQRYRADRARRASSAGLPNQLRNDRDAQVETLCCDAAEEGRRTLSVGIVGDIRTLSTASRARDSASAFRSKRPTSIIVAAQFKSSEQAARRAVSCDALSKAYAARGSPHLTAEVVPAYRLSYARPGSTSARSASRRISTRPAPPAPGGAALVRCESPFKSAPMPVLVAQPAGAAQLVEIAPPPASPLKPSAEQSYDGYPESILHQYEQSRDLIDQREVRLAVVSIVSDSFAVDFAAGRLSSGHRYDAPLSVGVEGEPVASEHTSSSGSSPSSGTFDCLLDAAADEAGIVEDPAQVRAENDPESPSTPETSFITLAPFPSPLSIFPLSFHWESSLATSTPLRPKDRPSVGARAVWASEPVEAAADETSPSLCSEASFSHACFAVATRATTTLPRVLYRTDPASPPTPLERPRTNLSSPVSPPAQMSSAGKREWRKLSLELGLPLARAVHQSGRFDAAGGALPKDEASSAACSTEVVAEPAPNGPGAPTPSDASLELVRSQLRAALGPAFCSYDTSVSEGDSQTVSAKVRADATAATDGGIYDGSIRRRLTPMYPPVGHTADSFAAPSVSADAARFDSTGESTAGFRLHPAGRADGQQPGRAQLRAARVGQLSATSEAADHSVAVCRSAMLQAWLSALDGTQPTVERS